MWFPEPDWPLRQQVLLRPVDALQCKRQMHKRFDIGQGTKFTILAVIQVQGTHKVGVIADAMLGCQAQVPC